MGEEPLHARGPCVHLSGGDIRRKMLENVDFITIDEMGLMPLEPVMFTYKSG